MGKINTPEWIIEGYDSPGAWKKAKGIKSEKVAKPKKNAELEKKERASNKKVKSYKIKICPKCKSDEVVVVLNGEERRNLGEWECHKCKWKGRNIDEKELNEDEFMEYVDRKGIN